MDFKCSFILFFQKSYLVPSNVGGLLDARPWCPSLCTIIEVDVRLLSTVLGSDTTCWIVIRGYEGGCIASFRNLRIIAELSAK